MSTWHITTPLLSSLDVEHHQKAVNRVFDQFGFGWLAVTVDGQFGPDSLRGSRQAAYMVGALAGEIERIIHGALSEQTRKLIARSRSPRLREKVAAKRRLPRIERRRKRHREGSLAVLAWAAQQIGVTESPAGSNRGPKVSVWERDFGMDGQPWCGAFAGYASKHYGGAPLTNRVVYVPYSLYDSQHGINGFACAISVKNAKPGDHVFYGFGHSYPVHTGLVVAIEKGELVAIEGNTSSSSAGSQSNGGMVAKRVRSFSDVIACGRPFYG